MSLLIEIASFLHIRLANATKTRDDTYVDTWFRYPVPAFTNTRTVQRDTGSTVAVLEPGHENEQLLYAISASGVCLWDKHCFLLPGCCPLHMHVRSKLGTFLVGTQSRIAQSVARLTVWLKKFQGGESHDFLQSFCTWFRTERVKNVYHLLNSQWIFMR